MPTKIILLGLILLALVGVMFYFSNSPEKIVSSSLDNKTTQNILPSPTPMPFAELTIPYLREREYESSLGQLQQVSSGSSYTSYLTSYTSDKIKINALLTKPSGEMPIGGWPAVIFIHGYIPPLQYRTTEKYEDYINFLASNGLVVFKIDLRGHGDSEGEASGGYFSSDYVIDTLNAYDSLQKTDFVNPEKIGLWGHSMSGNIVMRATTVKPEIPATVIWAGAVYTYEDLADYGISDSSYQPSQTSSESTKKRQQVREIYGNPDLNKPFWQQMAPVTYLQDLKGAIQLNHAVNDDVVSIEYSRNLNELLNEVNIPHELHEYSGGGHNINGGSFTEAMQNTVDFYKKHLQ
jgi:uncharacterized protein